MVSTSASWLQFTGWARAAAAPNPTATTPAAASLAAAVTARATRGIGHPSRGEHTRRGGPRGSRRGTIRPPSRKEFAHGRCRLVAPGGLELPGPAAPDVDRRALGRCHLGRELRNA